MRSSLHLEVAFWEWCWGRGEFFATLATFSLLFASPPIFAVFLLLLPSLGYGHPRRLISGAVCVQGYRKGRDPTFQMQLKTRVLEIIEVCVLFFPSPLVSAPSPLFFSRFSPKLATNPRFLLTVLHKTIHRPKNPSPSPPSHRSSGPYRI